jgi:protein-S-isoprenylcysteine O-methyltransferase Ste14
MELREHFVRSGNWLFRWRSYLPLLLLAIVMLALRDFRYPQGSHGLDEAWEAFCFAIGVAGLAVRAAALGYAPTGTSGRNTRKQVAQVLNTAGMYSMVRHPLYLGNYLMWVSVSLLPRAWWAPLLVTLAFWLYYERIMYAEEDFLRERFGDAFREWARVTPAFVPDPRRWARPEGRFCWRRIAKREPAAVLGLVASFALFDVAADFVVMRHFSVDPVWAAVFASTLAVYALLSLLRKRTRLLD